MMACFGSGRFPKISDYHLHSREELRMVLGNYGSCKLSGSLGATNIFEVRVRP